MWTGFEPFGNKILAVEFVQIAYIANTQVTNNEHGYISAHNGSGLFGSLFFQLCTSKRGS